MYSKINSQPKPNKVAVCLYLYHTDLWPEFKSLLLPIRHRIKLYIGLCSDHPVVSDFDDFDHSVSIHENYGVDVAPFLSQLHSIQEEIFIKLHSKKSYWGHKFHINWRQFIVNDLIGSETIFDSNIKFLLSKKSFAVLGNKHLLMENREAKNSKLIEQICNILNMSYDKIKNSKFIAGNMFVGKTKFFQEVLTKEKVLIIDNYLKQERGKVDDLYTGTYSHAMERIFGYIVSYYKYKFAHPKHRKIKILNKKAPNKKYFSLIKQYNDYCYLVEDPNVYGFYQKTDEDLTITWYHLDNPTPQRYVAINKNTIKKL